MQQLAELCERIAATTKKTEKVAMVAEYFHSREPKDAALSAVFLSGRAFAAFDERTLQIGGSLLWKLVGEITGARDASLTAAYRQRGDLGAAAVRCAAGQSAEDVDDNAARSPRNLRPHRRNAHRCR